MMSLPEKCRHTAKTNNRKRPSSNVLALDWLTSTCQSFLMTSGSLRRREQENVSESACKATEKLVTSELKHLLRQR